MMALQIQRARAVAANDEPAAGALPGGLHGFHRIGGDAAVMLPEAVTAWVEAARPNDRRAYAFGYLPVWSKGPKLMRELSAQGFVELTCDRKNSPKAYLARRTAKPWPAAKPEARKVARPVACYDSHLSELMDLVREWAAAEAPVPPNAEIAEQLGLARGVQVTYLFGVLERSGAIRRLAIKDFPFRVIIDVKAGTRTGGGSDDDAVVGEQNRDAKGRWA